MKKTFASVSAMRHFAESVLFRNVVLIQALGICPIIAVSTHLKYGVALTACTFAVLLPTSLTMSLIGQRIPFWLRAPLYTLGATALLLGAGWLMDRYISHEMYAALYLYLPLMAVNTLFSFCAGTFSVRNTLLHSMVDVCASSVGFGLVICTVSLLREVLAFGTVWDIAVLAEPPATQAAAPFAGFLLLGLMGALLQKLTKRFTVDRKTEGGEG